MFFTLYIACSHFLLLFLFFLSLSSLCLALPNLDYSILGWVGEIDENQEVSIETSI